MNNNDAVFEHIINQLRAHYGASRGAVPTPMYEEMAGEIQSLKNQLRDSAELIKVLHATNERLERELAITKRNDMPEQAGCRREDTQVEEPWIKWDGGDCPVDANDIVAVVFKDGTEEAGHRALGYRWYHNSTVYDIIRYRVVKPECEHEWASLTRASQLECLKCGVIKK